MLLLIKMTTQFIQTILTIATNLLKTSTKVNSAYLDLARWDTKTRPYIEWFKWVDNL